ncbi:MAG: hypothetical protein QOI66_4417 [Myxococcales bacterium]|nr:hypothetical protein [Myxococcales bacterium]
MGAVWETFRVDILTKDVGLLAPEATGLTAPIQAARVVVTHGRESRSHVVVRSADSAADLPADDVVAKLFPADCVSCVRCDIDGDTTLSCPRTDELTLFSAASAVATLKRSWGWDESTTIVVRFADGQSFSIDPVFDGHAWSVVRGGGV